ncbi:MAG: diguanylate cyclase [Actinomycetales bacterium]|nr:diguanylate cyclase [Actinomycetales bacterium]
MSALMGHLLDECGVRRPVLIRGLPHQNDSTAREEIFCRELAARHIECDEDRILTGDFREDVTYRVMSGFLRSRRDLDAVVASNDESAFGVISALNEYGLDVPEDVLVSGYDNSVRAVTNWPGLTTVDQDLGEQGAVAAEMLLRMMAGETVEQRVVVPSRLVVRRSTSRSPGIRAASGRTEAAPGADVGQGAPASGPWLVNGRVVIEADQVASELEAAATATRETRKQLAILSTIMGLSRTMIRCESVFDVVDSLCARLGQLGITKCFLALQDRSLREEPPGGLDEPLRLAMAYRGGVLETPPETLFPYREILPRGLREELGTGVPILQPLSVGVSTFGYLVFDAERQSAVLSELLRVDLSRALDTVFNSLRAKAYTQSLERVVAERTRELQAAYEELERSAMHDGLTQIANRATFDAFLERQWATTIRCNTPLSLIMIDVDFFKDFNDRYGHVAGDSALQVVASCLRRSVRERDDIVCRYGGEEFVAVLPNSGAQGAMAVAVRFRRELAAAGIPHQASTISPLLTASLGIASMPSGNFTSARDLVQAADRALYTAKSRGRDRVVMNAENVPVSMS